MLSTQHKLDWNELHKVANVEAYLSHMEHLGIGADGVSQKVNRLETALKYRLMRCERADDTHFGIGMALTSIAMWQKQIRRDRSRKRHQRKELNAEESLSVEEIEMAVRCPRIWQHYRKTVMSVLQCHDVMPRDLELAIGAVMYLVMATSTSRPGACANFTIDEYNAGRTTEQGCLVCSVKEHKTGSMGSAKLTVGKEDIKALKDYVDYLRPKLLATRDSDLVFVRFEGKPVSRPRQLQEVMSRAFDVKLPSSVQIRKAIATEASRRMTAGDRRAVLGRMSHSEATHLLYHENLTSDGDAVRAHRLIKDLATSSTLETQPQPSSSSRSSKASSSSRSKASKDLAPRMRSRSASPTLSRSRSPSPIQTKKLKRQRWSQHLADKIEQEFATEIESAEEPWITLTGREDF